MGLEATTTRLSALRSAGWAWRAPVPEKNMHTLTCLLRALTFHSFDVVARLREVAQKMEAQACGTRTRFIWLPWRTLTPCCRWGARADHTIDRLPHES